MVWEETIIFRGVLSRKSNGMFTRWNKQTYELKARFLVEFKFGTSSSNSHPQQLFEITGAHIEDGTYITGKSTTFLLHLTNGTTIFFQAMTTIDKENWVNALKKAILESSQKKSNPEPSLASSFNEPPPSYSSEKISKSPSVQNFHQETDRSSIKTTASDSLPIIAYLDSFTDAVVVGDISGEIVAINEAAAKLFGYTKQELEKQPISTLMPEPYKSRHDSYLFRHQKFGTQNMLGQTRKLQGERKNREVFELQISLGKLPSDGHYIATMRELPN